MSTDAPILPSTDLTTEELAHLQCAIALAAESRENGNHPFGSVLVTPSGTVFEGRNTVLTQSDPTGHAETNLVRLAAPGLSETELAGSTLYTSTEPCVMCAGAIYWAGIGRVVFALSETGLAELTATKPDEPTLDLPCREVFARGRRDIEVIGPVDLPEATAVHAGFWI